MWNYDPQWIWKRVGALRLELARKYADKHKLFFSNARRILGLRDPVTPKSTAREAIPA